MVNDIVIGGIYQHYKGMKYRILQMVKHSETLEWMVVYECLYDNPESSFWVRPMNMFVETVEIDGMLVPRFKFIGEIEGKDRL